MKIWVKIVSQGYFSPNKPAGTVGIAYIYVNGKDYSKKKRGYNVVVVDEKTGIYDSLIIVCRSKGEV